MRRAVVADPPLRPGTGRGFFERRERGSTFRVLVKSDRGSSTRKQRFLKTVVVTLAHLKWESSHVETERNTVMFLGAT